MKRLHLLVMVVSCLLCRTALAESKGESEVRAVVESFRTAIIQKDASRFQALFHADTIPWIGVLSDATLKRAKERASRDGGAPPKEPKLQTNDSPSRFIAFVSGSTSRIEEKFNGLKIITDGDVASLSFDYGFYIDGKMTNSGQESWQLVRTEAGWRINAVIYSIEVPDR